MFGTNGITKDHLVGVAVGVGVTALGIYLYKKNQAKIDDFLRSQGINIKSSASSNFESMDIEALTEMKEHIEDLIAEKSAAEDATEEVIISDVE